MTVQSAVGIHEPYKEMSITKKVFLMYVSLTLVKVTHLVRVVAVGQVSPLSLENPLLLELVKPVGAIVLLLLLLNGRSAC